MTNREDIVCNCMGVTRQEIENAIKNEGCDTLEKIQDKLEAGTVCGVCVDDIEEILAETLKK
jgi:bacterioferritin-associated ferredoxin